MGELIGGFSGMKRAPLGSAEIRCVRRDRGEAGQAVDGEVKLSGILCVCGGQTFI